MGFAVFFVLSFLFVNAGSAYLKDVNQPVGSRHDLALGNVVEVANHNWKRQMENNGNTTWNFGGFTIRTILKEILENKDNISTPNISRECWNAFSKLLDPIVKSPNITIKLKAFLKSPLAKMIDAFGRIPAQRMLLGNIEFIGAYDECRALPEAKYCMSVSTILLGAKSGGTGGNMKTMFGSCVPKQCTVVDVGKMMSTLNYFTKDIITFGGFKVASQENFCEKPVEYSTGVIATITVMAVVLSLCGVGTLIEFVTSCCGGICFCSLLKCSLLKQNGNINQDIGTKTSSDPLIQEDESAAVEQNGHENDICQSNSTCDVTKDSTLSIPTLEIVKKRSPGRCVACFLTSFSLIKNIRAILSTRVADGSITSVNGIRVISLSWIILGHIYIVSLMEGQLDNIGNMATIVSRFTFLVVSNAYFSVDTFFLLGGLLVSYLTLKRISKQRMGCKDVGIFYLHRYLRLTPSLGLAILFHTNILPIILSGPKSLVLSQTNELRKQCHKYWWSTMLYFNNFYPTEIIHTCLEWTWYLANDMQFYIISPPLLLLMVWIEKRAQGFRKFNGVLLNFILVASLCFVSVVTTGVITGVYDIPNLVSALFVPGNPRMKHASMAMDRIYTMPYCRISPYLIGVYLGYLFSRKITLNCNSRGKTVAVYVFGWVVSIVTALACVYGPWHVFKANGHFFNDAENIIYAAMSRFAWAVAVAWVIYACHNKAGGLVNAFLSWKLWIPLSRLTYGAYLLHFMVVEYYLNSNELTNHYQDTTTVFNFISICVVSYAGAFMLAVCVEYPVFNLEKRLLKR